MILLKLTTPYVILPLAISQLTQSLGIPREALASDEKYRLSCQQVV